MQSSWQRKSLLFPNIWNKRWSGFRFFILIQCFSLRFYHFLNANLVITTSIIERHPFLSPPNTEIRQSGTAAPSKNHHFSLAIDFPQDFLTLEQGKVFRIPGAWRFGEGQRRFKIVSRGKENAFEWLTVRQEDRDWEDALDYVTFQMRLRTKRLLNRMKGEMSFVFFAWSFSSSFNQPTNQPNRSFFVYDLTMRSKIVVTHFNCMLCYSLLKFIPK